VNINITKPAPRELVMVDDVQYFIGRGRFGLGKLLKKPEDLASVRELTAGQFADNERMG